MTTPSTEPSALFTGDTWAWSRALPEYPASAGWVLKYALINAAHRINITGSASGDDHAISVPAVTTASYTAGSYTMQGYVELGALRHTITRRTVKVSAGFIDGTDTAADARSDAQIAWEAARAALKSYTETNGAVSEYEINGRRVKYSSPQQLRELVNYWAGEVQRERIEEKRRQGKSLAGRTITRFGR